MTDTDPQPEIQQQLDQGTYQVIRQRLDAQAADLRARLEKLNAARRDVFGGVETKLIATDRITTPHNCVPRDMVAAGDRFVFGFNVKFGLKKQIAPADVFAVYRYADEAFHEEPLGPLDDGEFLKDFTDLYRYYKDSRFAKFFRTGPHVYMKFRVGRDADDFKAAKWALTSEGDGLRRLHYLDNRSDHEVRYPKQSPFDWRRATREMHRPGEHPHVSIEDRLFVECVGGDLTIKVEDNTSSGQGIYAEPVDHADQTLDDAEIHFVTVGPMILLRVKPFQERRERFFIFNTKTQEVRRQDEIANACQLLPEDHGIIFPTGFYLTTGLAQTFPTPPATSVYERTVVSPNGEDYLYVFYERERGLYSLLPYNLIEQRVDTPIVCSGYCLFDDGTLIYFKTHDEPQKHHAIQVWQTPFHGPDFSRPTPHADTLLYKIGNRDIVRGMAECNQLLQLIDRDDPYQDLYLDVVRTASDLADSYHWLDEADCFEVGDTVRAIRATGQAAVGEYEKLQRERKATADATRAAEQAVQDAVSTNGARIYDSIQPFVDSLTSLRAVRGQVIGLRELKHVDSATVDALEARVAEESDAYAQRTVDYLLKPGSLKPYEDAAAALVPRIDELTKVADAKALGEDVDTAADELELLIETVGNLKIDDATQRTAIIDGISAVFGTLNAARSALHNRRQALGKAEGAAEFASQLKLLDQSVVNYLGLCDTPEDTDQYLTRLMVQVEELDGRFAEFDDFVVQLADKRTEVMGAFETRKLQLVEQRNQRAQALAQAADRVLAGVEGRVKRMDAVDEIHTYLAGDLMVDKARDLIRQLQGLGDTVRADDIHGRLKAIREDAVRQLKDKHDLQADGVNTIRFGRHVFSVNTQPIDLTTVVRDGELSLHVTGTRFFEPIGDEAIVAARDLWERPLVSESPTVYRAAYLAQLFVETLDETQRTEWATLDDAKRVQRVQAFMAPRYREGYAKGVHDADAAAIVTAVLGLASSIGLLRYPSRARALAALHWHTAAEDADRARLEDQVRGFAQVAAAFPGTAKQAQYIAELAAAVRCFAESHGLTDGIDADLAGAYLFHELVDRGCGDAGAFVIGPEAAAMIDGFRAHLKAERRGPAYRASLEPLTGVRRFLLIRDWLAAYADDVDAGEQPVIDGEPIPRRSRGLTGVILDEAAAALLTAGDQLIDPTRVVQASVRRDVTGLVGSHPTLDAGTLHVDYNAFHDTLATHRRDIVPRFEAFQSAKQRVVEEARGEMRVDDFKPKVLTSFVRNQLVGDVFLPLIGDNLAKQLGTAGADTRTDRMGLLLLISPPGYGKTTLMEYVAARLGVVFVKINGPALGHHVTSLDPAAAPNAAAREELHKLNLALEMGDNVVLYVDDIQHTHPEFLQKFISLCDATRRIEGVYGGEPKTYDLRGRKVAVVMAGNPYTESGERFRLPDMLTNRADTYNLGDIIGEHGEAFKRSYLENCLTSNPTLNTLASRDQSDVRGIIQIAETGSRDGVELKAAFGADEVDEMVGVMRKLIRVRDVILKVNQEYIRSAGIEDQYREEPAFLLQGSYRNMNRIAERVVPVMNDDELTTLIVSTYEQDAQTLTTGAEANLLKFREMLGLLDEAQAARWAEVRATFARNNAVRSLGGDEATAAVITQLSGIKEAMAGVVGAVQRPVEDGDADVAAVLQPALAQLAGSHHALLEGMQGLNLRGGFDAETLDAFRALTGKLDALVERPGVEPVAPAAPAALAPPPGEITGQPSPYEIRVINKVPSTFLYVMKEQFELMKAWLEPMTRINAAQDEDIRRLREGIDAMVERYGKLIDKVEKTGQGPGDEA